MRVTCLRPEGERWISSSFAPRLATSPAKLYRKGCEVSREPLGFFPVKGVSDAWISYKLRSCDGRPQGLLIAVRTESILVAPDDQGR